MRRNEINSYNFIMRGLLDNQFENLFLWVPFLMAFGAALYFSIGGEPQIPYPFIFAALFGVVAGVRRAPILVRACALFAFGFMYAMAFTHFVATPQMPRNVHDASIVGTIENIDYTDTKTRVVMRIDGRDINAGDTHTTIRASIMQNDAPLHIGDTVRATANLNRPNPPYAPGAFDYARWAYFNHLTATGFITEYEILSHNDANNINTLREYLHGAANSFLSDALVLGYKNIVPREENAIWTATGVGHVWSISGFHMTLVSGWLFAIFYSIFRLIAPITRRVPARVPATVCAWFGLLFYLFLSGIDVATIRAFLMATLVFAAFLCGRNAISMRNVCIAMMIIFLINPHYVMQAGFQLSFAAIFGLIWFWGTVKPRIPQNKILKILYTATMTSIIATVFTAPFVISHFGAFPIYSLIGNLVLLPIFSIAIMPLVIVGTITAPIGWHWPLDAGNAVYNFALQIATHITKLPFASMNMPYMSNTAITLFILAFASLMFVRPLRVKINYILFVALAAFGVVNVICAPRPVFYATYDHELVGFVENGKLEFNKGRASNHYFAFDTWKQLNGEPTGTKNTRCKHDHGLYIFHAPKFTLAYIQKFVPLSKHLVDLCRDDNIDYIVSYFKIDSPQCNHKILNDGFVIYGSGHVIYSPAHRPWHNPPKQNITPPPAP